MKLQEKFIDVIKTVAENSGNVDKRKIRRYFRNLAKNISWVYGEDQKKRAAKIARGI